MTWTEIALVCLLAERAFAIGLGFIAGARAAYRASTPRREPEPLLSTRVSSTGFPTAVEIESDDAVSLDYSSGIKRH